MRAQIDKFRKYVEPDTLSSFEIEQYLANYTDKPDRALTDIDALLESGNAKSEQSIMKLSRRYVDISVEQVCVLPLCVCCCCLVLCVRAS
jgi:hypothetical protein